MKVTKRATRMRARKSVDHSEPYRSTPAAATEPMQHVEVAADQSLFLVSRPALDLTAFP